MASTIKLKNGSGAPTAGDLVQGEPALDLTNKRLYTEDAGGNVIEIGTSPSTIDINAGTIDGTVIGGASAAAGTFTTLTATGNVVLGNAATDTVTVTADVASDLIPSADGTYDLGASGSEWQDLFIDGTANIDSLVADTADINGGTIDGTVIGGASAAAGTFTTLNATGGGSLTGTWSDLGSVTSVDINGGTIDGVTIGGSSAGAGTFTTLTTGSTVTLNGGTANGVLYLNGSKVATSGSALTFDGTNLVNTAGYLGTTQSGATSSYFIAKNSVATSGVVFGAHSSGAGYIDVINDNPLFFAVNDTERMRLTSTGLGIGTSSPATNLEISDDDVELRLTDTSGGYSDIRYAAGVLQIRADQGNNVGSSSMRFSVDGSERMRIDSSGNVGIGTSSPSLKLEVNGSAKFAGNYVSFNDNGYIRTDAANVLRFQPGSGGYEFRNSSNSGNLAVLNTSGNLGLGVTPSAWDVLPTIQISGYAAISSGGSYTHFSSNAYLSTYPTTWKYINSEPASRYEQTSGVHSWHTAASGTAGNTISWSERMRIDSSGNLLVGTTDEDLGYTDGDDGVGIFPWGGVQIARDSSFELLYLNKLNNAGDIIAFNVDGASVGAIGTESGFTYYTGGSGSGVKMKNAAVVPTNENGVDADGTESLGQSSARWSDLYLSGGVSNPAAGGTLTFGTAGSERMRIDSSGMILPGADDAQDLGSLTKRYDDVYATNALIQTSDRNEKQDIEALSEAEQRVAVAAKALLRKFRWKSKVEEKGDDARIHFGIIAQDLQAAFEAEGLDAGRYAMFIHSTWTDEETGEERSRMGVRYSELLAFIIAAI